MGDDLWHAKAAAGRLGVDLGEYLDRRAAGEKWCTRCKAWHAVSAFGRDRSRADGLNPKCRRRVVVTADERRSRARASYRRYYGGTGGPRIRAQKAARKRGCEPVDPRHRELVFERFDARCAYCGGPATTIDHVVPVVAGGGSGRGNLLPACRSCNSSKRSQSIDAFLVRRPEARIDLIAEEIIMAEVL